MQLQTLRRWVFFVGLSCLAVLIVGKARLDRHVNGRVEALLSAAEKTRSRHSTDHDTVPVPVRRYFDAVLDDDVSPVRSVRLRQRGEFRLGGRTGSWKPMRATQHYTVDPPGFIWDADIEVAPFLLARVVDAYEFGRGSLRVMVLSILPVATAEPSPEMNEGEILRYLGETVWFPTALLPEAGVEWEAIDEHTAKATVEDHGTTASLIFHFDENDLVERVSASERYRQESDSTAPWTGYFDRYEWRGDVRIPTEASVEWNLPDGDLPYWRARVMSIEHRRT